MSTSLNGFEIQFPEGTPFHAYVSELSNPEDLKAIREQERGEWFLHWRDGMLYGIPEVESPARSRGVRTALDLSNHYHLNVLAARINDRLPDKFPQYDALRKRPFEFLGKRDELVAAAAAGLSAVPPLLNRFKIRPRFELDARLYELRDGETRLGLFVSISTKSDIVASLSELQAAGIQLQGLYVIRRNPSVDERRLAGRLERVHEGRAYLSEAFDDAGYISEDEVWLEGSRTSFKRCLTTLLKGNYAAFDRRRADVEGELLGGPGIEQLCARMGEVLARSSPIQLGPGMQCNIRDRIAPENRDNYKTVVDIKQGEYCFDAAQKKRTKYAWMGIEKFGPFSRDTFPKRSPRILVFSPDSASGKVGQFIGLMRQGITSVPDSHFAGGLSKLFHLHNPEFQTVTIPTLGSTAQSAHVQYRQTIEGALRRSSDYDAALVAILDEHAGLDDAINPYAHSKALLLTAGIPVQHFRMATATQGARAQQNILQNIAVSLYAKMGGVPWTVDQGLAVDDEIVFGMGTAEVSGSRFDSRKRYVGITTVFRGDGNYLLGHLSRDCSYDDYPRVLRENTTTVLEEMRSRNGWRDGDTIRVIFHAHKPLKKIEVGQIVSDSVKAVGKGLQIQFAFLNVSQEHPFLVLDPAFEGVEVRLGNAIKAKMVPPRGRVVQLGRFTRLLCTKGPTLIKRPQTPLPAPLLIHLHEASSYRDLQYLSEQVLKFTSLSWRGTQPAEDPVTIYYSELIAKELSRLRGIDGWSPTILNTRLRHSMWFL